MQNYEATIQGQLHIAIVDLTRRGFVLDELLPKYQIQATLRAIELENQGKNVIILHSPDRGSRILYKEVK